ncbi:tRNA (uracil-5-)-methyltransferase homolog B-like [Antedon mediterranea]|uniref:tRNA (uracil-5-)-methyltransferase homolog B-like n=1 Tax=Antedon mediterranea TaxID=105859 RepID=UPI003AF9D464
MGMASFPIVGRGRRAVKTSFPLILSRQPADARTRLRKQSDVYRCFRNSHDGNVDYQIQMRNATSPLWRISYKMQLAIKYLHMKSVLQKLTNTLIELEAINGSLHTFVKTDLLNGLCCHLSQVIPSPQEEGYRNKSDLSVGVGEDGNIKTVGMFVGNWKRKNVVCVPADTCLNISHRHIYIGKLYQEFIRQCSLDVMRDFYGDGHLGGCAVRTNVAGNTMAIAQLNPKGLNTFQLNAYKEDLKNFFLKFNPGSLSSLYLQCSSKTKTYDDDSIELLFGEQYIHEKLHDLTFRISPLAFFQPNTKCAEVLYSTIQELAIANSEKEILLLDLYCGTGTIGLYLSKSVQKVIGIEIVPQAVQDAIVNSSINGITNAEFLCGSVEKVLPQILASLQPNQQVVAVVDPSRNGLHSNVVKSLRNCESVSKLIYVSCKPDGNSFKDFIKLCQPEGEGTASRKAWYPINAVPVDMFPQTLHCELVIEFKRK